MHLSPIPAVPGGVHHPEAVFLFGARHDQQRVGRARGFAEIHVHGRIAAVLLVQGIHLVENILGKGHPLHALQGLGYFVIGLLQVARTHQRAHVPRRAVHPQVGQRHRIYRPGTHVAAIILVLLAHAIGSLGQVQGAAFLASQPVPAHKGGVLGDVLGNVPHAPGLHLLGRRNPVIRFLQAKVHPGLHLFPGAALWQCPGRLRPGARRKRQDHQHQAKHFSPHGAAPFSPGVTRCFLCFHSHQTCKRHFAALRI